MNSKIDFLSENMVSLITKVDRIGEDVDILRTDVDIMKAMLKRKVDIDEFKAFEKRIQKLEGRHIA